MRVRLTLRRVEERVRMHELRGDFVTEQRTLVEQQEVIFQPSAFYANAKPLAAIVTKVWGPGCVNIRVAYPDGAREETSVLACFPHQVRPSGGYFCYPKEN